MYASNYTFGYTKLNTVFTTKKKSNYKVTELVTTVLLYNRYVPDKFKSICNIIYKKSSRSKSA